MGVGALFKAGLVEWMSTHDLPGGLGRRRAAHARAADAVRHAQRRGAGRCSTTRSRRSSRSTARCSPRQQRACRPPRPSNFGVPLGGSPDPVDRQGPGQRHEPRGVEGRRRDQQDPRPRRRLRHAAPMPVDGFCVRVGAMRCHSQALTFKLKKDVPLADIEAMIAADNAWVKVVPNNREATMQRADAGGRDRHDGHSGGPPAQAGDGAASTSAPSPSATSCCGAPPSRCAACCASCSTHECALRPLRRPAITGYRPLSTSAT